MNLFPLLDGESVTEIEDRLLPVGVASLGTSRKDDGLVTGTKDNIKVTNECMDVVRASCFYRKGGSELEVLNLDGVKVEFSENARRCGKSISINRINERLL